MRWQVIAPVSCLFSQARRYRCGKRSSLEIGDREFNVSSIRILIYSHDGLGLGHTSRALAIASHISQHIENCSILLLTDLSIVGKLRLPPNVDYVHLPGVVREADLGYRSRNLNIKAKKTLRIRCKITQSAAKTFNPQLMIIDRDPTSISMEMRRNLSFMNEVLPRTKIVWSLPDILGDPGMVVQSWHREYVYKILHHFCDEIWIYGVSEIFNQAKSYQFPATLLERTFHLGYLRARKLETTEMPKDLQRLGTEKPFVLVTAGSGMEAYPLVDAYLGFLEEMDEELPFSSIIITGPMMPSADKKAFLERAAHLKDVIFHRFNKNILQYLHRARLVVSTGGYNTLCEILTYNKNTIFIPGLVPPNEHLSRAQLFAKLGLIQFIEPDKLSADSLGEMVLSAIETDALAHDQNAGVNVPLDGLDSIISRIRLLTQQPESKTNEIAG